MSDPVTFYKGRQVSFIVSAGEGGGVSFALGELIKDETKKQIFKFVLAPLEAVYPILTPPGVPRDRLEVLRGAFTKAINATDFLKAADKIGLEVEKVTAEKISQIIGEIYSMRPEIVKAGMEAAGATGE